MALDSAAGASPAMIIVGQSVMGCLCLLLARHGKRELQELEDAKRLGADNVPNAGALLKFLHPYRRTFILLGIRGAYGMSIVFFTTAIIVGLRVL